MERLEYTITEGVFFEIICKTIDHDEYINSSALGWEWNKLDIDTGNYTILNTSKSQSLYKESTDGRLYIIKTTPENEGSYKCIVTNENGIDYLIIGLKIRGIKLY